MVNQFMGYTVHGAAEFRPNMVLFTRENETITVSMLQEALGHIVDAIANKNPTFRQYKITLKVLQAIQVRLTNRQVQRPSKEELKTACEVLSEIQKEHATTQAQKDNIDAAASRCKLFIECFMQD